MMTVSRIAEIRRGMRKPKYEQGWATDAEWMEILTIAQEAIREREAVQIIVRTNEDASLDEAIVKGGYAHLEQMAKDHWSLVMELGEQRIIIGLHSQTRIRAVLVDDGKVKLIDDSNASPLPQERAEK